MKIAFYLMGIMDLVSGSLILYLLRGSGRLISSISLFLGLGMIVKGFTTFL